MENSKTVNTFLISETQKAFDQLLASHLNRIHEFRTSHYILPVSVPLLAIIFLIVDREKEIAAFQGNSIQRFDAGMLLEELSEIGVLSPELLNETIRLLVKYDYISVTEEGRYAALEPAFRLAQAVDSHFSQMPGMSLIAYLIQSVEEVISGRKDYDYCIRQVDQTLLSRTRFAKHQPASAKPSSDSSVERKTADLLKLVRKRAVETDLETTEPHILSRQGFSSDVKVTDIFPSSQKQPSETDEEASADPLPAPDTLQSDDQNPAPDEIVEPEAPADVADLYDEPPHETQTVIPEGVEEEVIAPVAIAETSESPAVVPDEETTAAETIIEDEPEVRVEEIQDEAPVPGLAQAEPEEKLPDSAVSTPDLQQPSEAPEESDTGEGEDEDPIEQQIKAFEYRLASVCPICELGEVVANSTPKGKTYYSCSNSDCKFISWGKPYHFVCPLCQNKFLIEHVFPSGEIGLRCPRATCTYRQHTLEAPEIAKVAGRSPDSPASNGKASAPDGGKEKKRIVRKKLVRRKR